jgi:hypothetical protein
MQGASAGITFNGTGAVLFGSRGFDHVCPLLAEPCRCFLTSAQGNYSVTLDGTTTSTDSQLQQDVLQAPLFAQTDLPPGTHHVAINDTSTATLSIASLDVDNITLILGDGDATYVSSFLAREPCPDPARAQHTDDLDHAGRHRRQLHLLARLGLVPQLLQRVLPEPDDAVRSSAPPTSRSLTIARAAA